jgi:hypothetical protein
MRLIYICVLIMMTGCAVKLAPTDFDRSDMAHFQPSCTQAQSQVDYLQGRIRAYHDYFKSRPITVDDRKYYTKLKNNFWALRSSCSALQL